jgi:hypothetical protein
LAGLVIEVQEAFTLLGDGQLAQIKRRVIPRMQKLNGTDRGYCALDWLDERRRKSLEYVAPYALAKAIQGAFDLEYPPACGECDWIFNSPSSMTTM